MVFSELSSSFHIVYTKILAREQLSHNYSISHNLAQLRTFSDLLTFLRFSQIHTITLSLQPDSLFRNSWQINDLQIGPGIVHFLSSISPQCRSGRSENGHFILPCQVTAKMCNFDELLRFAHNSLIWQGVGSKSNDLTCILTCILGFALGVWNH